ncbi:hypothetical protein A616_04140 [Brevibacillus brevis X23]|nr:hypothetical protein A616_04140 [Brevibacillus brevis X23]
MDNHLLPPQNGNWEEVNHLFIRVVMDSGKEYILEETMDSFKKESTNALGIIVNEFQKVYVNDKPVLINPSHVSSVEEIEE